MTPDTATAPGLAVSIRQLGSYFHRAFRLAITTNPRLALLLAGCTLAAGVLPAGMAWVGKLIIDGVIAAAAGTADAQAVLQLIGVEALLVALIAAAQRGIALCESLLRAQLGYRVNDMILAKALTLELAQFEDSEFYDKLSRARRDASTRPLNLVRQSFGLLQNLISLASYAVLLSQLSVLAVGVFLLAGLPAFLAEANFSGEAFALFRWRSPDTRMQIYLETVLAREDHAKEVKVYGLGRRILDRYGDIFRKLYRRDRNLALRRESWGFLLGLLGTLALYGGYGWVALQAVAQRISLGEMTMYLLLLRQGQAAVTASLSALGGLYEDNLYLTNLYEFLEQPVPEASGRTPTGVAPGDGIRFEGVSFRYPGATGDAVSGIDLHLVPGCSLALVGDNGAGKTTLIKLLTRLYRPTQGRILLDGTPLDAWDEATLRQRIAVVFQDFNRYQFTVGENIGAGDVHHMLDEPRWRQAAADGLAAPFVEALPGQYRAQLGSWFKGGRELSGGQWQKLALSRAFMRREADILVLDEPTAAMDAQAEADVFEHFRRLAADRMAILISHRFSTVRMADEILVMRDGAITERGTHAALVAKGGHYARLFALQAAGYR
ncbi:MAG: ABC transporter ATP-binding protein [Immundisolibacter sp.]|uniref:ABC transporter ATP-binding protein n=1 Tax=Immundisolibacter sp. TaxID=1934948 RepID=UPI003EE21492